MIVKLWKNYTTSGFDTSQFDDDFINHVKFINYFSLVGIFSAMIYGVFNINERNFLLGQLEILLSCLAILNVIYFRISANYEIASNGIIFLMIAMLSILLISGGIHQTGIFWFYTFPPLAFFLKGRIKGCFYVFIVYVITLGGYILFKTDFIHDFPYNFIQIRQFLSSFTAVVLLVYFYERVRGEAEYKIRRNEKELLVKNLYDEQIREAGKIQKTLIPPDSLGSSFDISGFYQPAMEVGGDYIDFFKIDNDRSGILIADVAGKGVPAAMIMVKVRTIVKMSSRLNLQNPFELLSVINKSLINNLTYETFITMLYIVLDEKNKTIKYCNAGHLPLAYYSKQDDKIHEIKNLSLPVGIISEDNQYEDHELNLHSGDIILLYTDGVTEARKKNGRFYGRNRLFSKLIKYSDLSAKDITDKITLDISLFTEDDPQSDDIALVVIKLK